MSDYDNASDIAERQLRNISKSMCYAKWSQVSLHLTNGKTHSCYHPPTHSIDVTELKDNPSALHNTKQKKEERKMMLEGKRPEGCSYCWKIEDAGHRSDRIHRSGEYWAQNSRQDIIKTLDIGNINPRYVEVNFNQACNFKCSYCSPHLSNTWEKEIKQHGPYNIITTDKQTVMHNDINHLDKIELMPIKVAQAENPYIEAFWRWWPELYETLEVFRMTGGEPLMDSNTFKVLDYIYEHPNAWLEVSVTSNMCPPKPKLMDKFIDKLQKLEEIQIWKSERFNPGSGNHWYVNMAVKNFAVFVSLDGVGKQAEYMRNGLDYDLLQTNVQRILNETDNTTLTFINTFNNLSLPSFKEFLIYILRLREQFSSDKQGIKYKDIYDPYNTHKPYEIHPRQRIWFDVPILEKPVWQNIHTIPAEYEIYLEEAIDFMEEHQDTSNFVGFYDFEIEKVKRNLNLMREGREKLTEQEIETARYNFVKFFKQHDARRGTNFLKTFPEYLRLWNNYG